VTNQLKSTRTITVSHVDRIVLVMGQEPMWNNTGAARWGSGASGTSQEGMLIPGNIFWPREPDRKPMTTTAKVITAITMNTGKEQPRQPRRLG
jgi:hypothetical protein